VATWLNGDGEVEAAGETQVDLGPGESHKVKIELLAPASAGTWTLGARRRGPGLARVMAAVADSVAEEVAMRRKVEAERAKPRATARAVTLITLGVVAIGALNGTYLAPYRTTLGQLVLAAITLGFVGALAWMRALTLTKPEPRFLVSRARRGHGRSVPTSENSYLPSQMGLT